MSWNGLGGKEFDGSYKFRKEKVMEISESRLGGSKCGDKENWTGREK